MSAPTFFKPAAQFHVMEAPTRSVIAVLNAALSGIGTVTITASKRGLKIKLGRMTLASGRTPQELHDAFKAAQEANRKAAQQGN